MCIRDRIKRFAKKPEKKEKTKETSPMRVNVLGMLPLDVGNKGNCERILEFLKNNGCEVAADFAMGLSVEQIKACTGADLDVYKRQVQSGIYGYFRSDGLSDEKVYGVSGGTDCDCHFLCVGSHDSPGLFPVSYTHLNGELSGNVC